MDSYTLFIAILEKFLSTKVLGSAEACTNALHRPLEVYTTQMNT